MSSESVSAGERAYVNVRDAILSGRYEGGTMLSEIELASEFGVSRTPVRYALARLQEEGWITIYPKRGALVRVLTHTAVAQLASAKVMLEAGTVVLTKPAARRQLADKLRPHLEKQRTALQSSDVGAFVELSIEFHRAFVEIGDNAVVLELYDRLADRQRFVLFSFGNQLLDRAEALIDEHSLMLDCLTSDDPADFEEILRKHLAETYSTD